MACMDIEYLYKKKKCFEEFPSPVLILAGKAMLPANV